MQTILRLALPLIAVAACGNSYVSDFASRHPDCDENRITNVEIPQATHTVTRVSGCGLTEDYINWENGAEMSVEDALVHASFAASCPREDLEYQVLAMHTIGVSACGQRLVYKVVPGVGWVLESEAAPAEPSAP